MQFPANRIEDALATNVIDTTAYSSSWNIQIFKAELADRRAILVKHGRSDIPDHLELEGFMLNQLANNSPLPIPKIWHVEGDLLVMEWIETTGALTPTHERHAGELLASCHTVRQSHFGYKKDTVIGALPQPNPHTSSWRQFFADQRLGFMANIAFNKNRLPASFLPRIDALRAKLDDYIDEPSHPALLHGDLWGGNILPGANGKIAAFIDPAIYFGHPEIELAFTQMFNTFSEPFFEAYAANAPFERDFFDLRCDLYNLYPTLVHVALFGHSYLAPIDRTLKRLGI